MPGTVPVPWACRRRGPSGRLLAATAPLILFALLTALAWAQLPEDGEPAWLQQAAARAAEIRAAGNLLAPAEAVADPRATFGALLLLATIPAELVLLLLRALGLAIGALALLLAMRGGVAGASRSNASLPALIELLPAYLLAGSSYWVHASLEADPYLAVGILFLLIARGQGPTWALGIALAWALSWSPWAWLALWPLAWGGLLGEQRARRRAVLLLVLGTLLVGVFAAPALRDPRAWFEAMRWQAQIDGLASEMRPFGVAVGTLPLVATLHGPGWLLVLLGAGRWPRRARRGDLSPSIALLVIVVALPAGFAHRAPLLLLLVWAAMEAGRGAAAAWRLLPRPVWGWLIALVAILPLLATQISTAAVRRSGVSPGASAITDLEARLPAGSLVAYDLGLPAPQGSRLHWVAIPFHSVAPEIHRGAYWTGWYRGFAAYAVSEQMVRRYLAWAEAFPEVITFYATLDQAGESQRLYGTHPGHRARVIEQEAAPDGMPAPGWRERIAAGRRGGLQGAFLARLGGALIRAGRDAAGVAVLEEARMAGFEEPGIFVNLAGGYLTQDRLLDAGRVLETGLARHPEEPDLLYNLGLVLTRLGYWERAVETLGHLRTLRPNSAEVLYRLGVSLANAGHPVAARRALSEAQTLAGDAEMRGRIGAALEAIGTK